MAIARLPLILILVFYTQKVCFTHGQILSSCSSSNPNTSLSSLIASDPRIGDLISKAKSQKLSASQDAKTASKGTTINILAQKNKVPQSRIGLQDFLNLRQQQQGLTVPLNTQPLSKITQSPIGSQDKQPPSLTRQQPASLQQSTNHNLQSYTNLQKQALNSQSINHQSNINLQSVQESTKTSLNIPQQALQQQSIQSFLPRKIKGTDLQTSILSEIPLASSLAVNEQAQGLPSQVSQGVLLSNLGLSSSLPSILTNSCSKPTTNQNFIVPQNDATSQCKIPFSVLDGSKNSNAFLISSSFPSESTSNTQFQSNSVFIPLNYQNSIASQPIDHAFNGLSCIQYQEIPNQDDDQSLHMPIQMPQTVQVQQFNQPQYVQSQPSQSITSVPHQSVEIQSVPKPTSSPESFPQSIHAPTIVLQPSTQTQSIQIPSAPTTQSQPPSANSVLPPSPQYSLNPLIYSPKHSTKSTMKALLPLLFNLLKDKNSACCCSPSCNCGCMNNFGFVQEPQYMNPFMNNNYDADINIDKSVESDPDDETEDEETNNNFNVNDDHPKPQVTDGYANQIKYGLPVDKEESQNFIESVEIVTPSPKKLNEKKYITKDYQYQNYKIEKNESIEYDDDYDDSYENED